MKKLLALFTAMLFIPLGLAQNDIDIDPGPITPESPIYGLDVAADNALVNIGIEDSGDVAHERASEMYNMQERNRTRAYERALEQMQRMVNRTQNETVGLQRAEQVLQRVRERAQNVEQREGIDTALQQISNIRNRVGIE